MIIHFFCKGAAGNFFCLIMLVFALAARAQSDFQSNSRIYLTPSGVSGQRGNDSRFLPFDNHPDNEGEGMRFQQVFMASEFGGSPGYITALYFRGDEFMVAQAAEVSSLQVNLSTTLATASSLSPVFADNIGSDNQVFWGPSGKLLSTYGAFDMEFRTETPFYYDPSRGNLLMEIKNFSGSRPGDSLVLDAHSSVNDGIASVAAWGANSLSGGYDLGGYVMLIEMVQVPEAAAWKLAMLGAVILVVVGRRRFV